MLLQALDLDELGVMPFDAEAFTTLVQPAANSMNGRESLDDLRRWYDMGFISHLERNGGRVVSVWRRCVTDQARPKTVIRAPKTHICHPPSCSGSGASGNHSSRQATI
jgi:hypothetical protein